MMRFERFTERAQDAAVRATEILQRYGHNQVDTEHVLLALLEQPDGVVSQLLTKMNIDPNAMRTRLDEILRASPKAAIYGGGNGQVFITPRAKRVIDLANEEANPPQGRIHLHRAYLPRHFERAEHRRQQDHAG